MRHNEKVYQAAKSILADDYKMPLDLKEYDELCMAARAHAMSFRRPDKKLENLVIHVMYKGGLVSLLWENDRVEEVIPANVAVPEWLGKRLQTA